MIPYVLIFFKEMTTYRLIPEKRHAFTLPLENIESKRHLLVEESHEIGGGTCRFQHISLSDILRNYKWVVFQESKHKA